MTHQFISIPSDESERGFETHPIDSLEQVESAKARLRELGLTDAAVYVGEETDPDSHTNGQVLFA